MQKTETIVSKKNPEKYPCCGSYKLHSTNNNFSHQYIDKKGRKRFTF